MSDKISSREVTLRCVLAYIVPICLFSLLICAAIVSVGNDMYAFVKSDEMTTLAVMESDDMDSLIGMLSDNGIVNNPTIFKMYVKSKGKEEVLASFAGEITLSPSMSYREILSAFS